jgi:peroxiredoxin
MKLLARISVITILSVFIMLIVLKITKKIVLKNEINKQENYLPEFGLQCLDDTSMKNITVDYNESLIINYFNTHCDFCFHEIKDIITHKHLFTNDNILLVSDQPIDTLIKFKKNMQIDSFPFITIGKVNYPDFVEKFGNVIPPTTFIYDSNKRLIKKHKGQVRAPVVADDIKKYYTKIKE